MSEAEFQIVKSIGFLSALVLAVTLQRIFPHARSKGSWRTNGGLWAVNLLVIGLACAGCACTVARWASAEEIGLFNRIRLEPWVATIISIVCLDAVSYAWHRANHRFSFLWRFHQVHHSDPTFTASTGLRFHFGELLLALPVRLVAIIALGMSIPAIILFEIVFALATFFEHGDIDLSRRLEDRLTRVFISPALHRRHHSREARSLNSNYGTILSIWDRLFGSFGSSDSGVRIEPGLPGVATHLRLADGLTMPLRGVFRGR